MKRVILFLSFILMLLSNTIANANYVYKNTEFGVDFIIPVLDNADVDNSINTVNWQFLTKDMKNKNCRMRDSDIKKFQEIMIKEKYTFGLFSLNKNNDVENKIYVRITKSMSHDMCTFNTDILKSVVKNAAYELYKEGYKQNKTFCGSKIYQGPIGREKSYEVILSNGSGYGVKAEAGRLGRKLKISGYTNNLEELNNTLKAINFIFDRADFDATYPENYFKLELEKI